MNLFRWASALALIMAIQPAMTRTAEAGPLLDWLTGKNRNQPAQQVAYMPATGCQTCTMTCKRQVVNYVPQTQYRTNWTQVPVTTYRPVTTSDPCTGCSVTCMKPCTSYRWQAQRVPYTTYRPVYSTVTTQRPVTSMMPATTGCSTCGVNNPVPSVPTTGVITPGTTYQPQPVPTPAPTLPSMPSTVPPAGTTYPGGGTLQPSPIPANNPPSLDPRTLPNTTQRIVIPPANGSSILQNPSLSIPQPPTSTPGTTSSPSPTPVEPAPAAAPMSGVNAPISPSPATHSSSQPGIQPITDPNPGLRNSLPAVPAPALLPPNDQTAQSPVRRSWEYSPVRLAVYQEGSAPVQTSGYRQVVPAPAPATVQPAPANHGWRSLNRR